MMNTDCLSFPGIGLCSGSGKCNSWFFLHLIRMTKVQVSIAHKMALTFVVTTACTCKYLLFFSKDEEYYNTK